MTAAVIVTVSRVLFGSTVCHFLCIAQSPLARRTYLARNRRVDESSRFVIDARSTFARPGQEAGTAPRPGRRVTIPSGAFPCNPRSLTGTCALPQTASWPWTFYLAFPRATIWSFCLGERKLPCQKVDPPPFFRPGGKQIVERTRRCGVRSPRVSSGQG